MGAGGAAGQQRRPGEQQRAPRGDGGGRPPGAGAGPGGREEPGAVGCPVSGQQAQRGPGQQRGGEGRGQGQQERFGGGQCAYPGPRGAAGPQQRRLRGPFGAQELCDEQQCQPRQQHQLQRGDQQGGARHEQGALQRGQQPGQVRPGDGVRRPGRGAEGFDGVRHPAAQVADAGAVEGGEVGVGLPAGLGGPQRAARAVRGGAGGEGAAGDGERPVAGEVPHGDALAVQRVEGPPGGGAGGDGGVDPGDLDADVGRSVQSAGDAEGVAHVQAEPLRGPLRHRRAHGGRCPCAPAAHVRGPGRGAGPGAGHHPDVVTGEGGEAGQFRSAVLCPVRRSVGRGPAGRGAVGRGAVGRGVAVGPAVVPAPGGGGLVPAPGGGGQCVGARAGAGGDGDREPVEGAGRRLAHRRVGGAPVLGRHVGADVQHGAGRRPVLQGVPQTRVADGRGEGGEGGQHAGGRHHGEQRGGDE